MKSRARWDDGVAGLKRMNPYHTEIRGHIDLCCTLYVDEKIVMECGREFSEKEQNRQQWC
ncbi:hypothetical protein ACRALDRAFT_2060060 [Sodiomyces alcalophilus JCM 7366]|uniref:uncharacterized protein n=1 Tax=Sodiomyces alcalophilus JCM 7366 TaxID=591952 RepID=UPI0039B6CBDA